ncbi:CYTH domain-containing protein [Streptosporangium sp. NPDC020072]|uniref:CYTH domain-containing protein n=1 Tax=Streptosporangium sp. NPDC020072 TaxID=3154788 RepID=UPI00342D2BD9
MAVEIERRFLVSDDAWREEVTGVFAIRQGFLSLDRQRIVRVRLIGEKTGKLTVKGLRVENRRHEFEYDIPAQDAAFMLDEQCHHPLIVKERHVLGRRHPGEWVVDVFREANDGLVIAEVEFGKDEAITAPEWAGLEVSTDDRYANSSLVTNPFKYWDAS